MLTGIILVVIAYCLWWANFTYDHQITPSLGLVLAIAGLLTGLTGFVMFATAIVRAFMTVTL